MDFSERLKELRAEKGLSQTDLAKQTGISQSAITKWENNVHYPFGQLIVLAKYFDVSVDYLLGLTDDFK